MSLALFGSYAEGNIDEKSDIDFLAVTQTKKGPFVPAIDQLEEALQKDLSISVFKLSVIWIVLIEFLLAMTPGSFPVLIYLHVVLGAAIVGFAFYNFSGIRKTRVLGRVKRIAQACFNISVLVAILGALLFFDVGKVWVIPLINVSFYGLILFLHVVNSFAIITQAAAVAIAYDMWEDKEFEKETEPWIVPPMPMPQKDAR
ncbi:MAG: nucleotidyltransferase domain-containing protein [Methanobacteriota archaeon]